MGTHHIPHTEDFPTTPTVGLDLDFFLLPYNYFDEDPAMSSNDWVRIEPRSEEDIRQGVYITRNANDNNKCVPPVKTSTIDAAIQHNPNTLFN